MQSNRAVHNQWSFKDNPQKMILINRSEITKFYTYPTWVLTSKSLSYVQRPPYKNSILGFHSRNYKLVELVIPLLETPNGVTYSGDYVKWLFFFFHKCLLLFTLFSHCTCDIPSVSYKNVIYAVWLVILTTVFNIALTKYFLNYM